MEYVRNHSNIFLCRSNLIRWIIWNNINEKNKQVNKLMTTGNHNYTKTLFYVDAIHVMKTQTSLIHFRLFWFNKWRTVGLRK